ncbi:MAG TPA: hypothetical protein VFW33_08540 [Gemmataceae bacterium]|nr:hypothetical protein [Gemmataceae bacterium]
MPSLTSPFRRVGRLVADQVGRLHSALEHLAGEVRVAIARAVGQATGEAAREAIRVILDGPPDRPRYDRPDARDGGWGQQRRPTWPAPHGHEPYGRDPYEPDPDDPDDEPRHRYDDADEESRADTPAATRRPGHWSRAVAAGCQAAGWWLRRHPGRFAIIAAAGIGIAAGVATLVSSPLVAGASAAAASALGLLALADAACAASGLADQALN